MANVGEAMRVVRSSLCHIMNFITPLLLMIVIHLAMLLQYDKTNDKMWMQIDLNIKISVT